MKKTGRDAAGWGLVEGGCVPGGSRGYVWLEAGEGGRAVRCPLDVACSAWAAVCGMLTRG